VDIFVTDVLFNVIHEDVSAITTLLSSPVSCGHVASASWCAAETPMQPQV
jgi:hypothetical protein